MQSKSSYKSRSREGRRRGSRERARLRLHKGLLLSQESPKIVNTFSALNKDPRCLKSFIKTYCEVVTGKNSFKKKETRFLRMAHWKVFQNVTEVQFLKSLTVNLWNFPKPLITRVCSRQFLACWFTPLSQSKWLYLLRRKQWGSQRSGVSQGGSARWQGFYDPGFACPQMLARVTGGDLHQGTEPILTKLAEDSSVNQDANSIFIFEKTIFIHQCI